MDSSTNQRRVKAFQPITKTRLTNYEALIAQDEKLPAQFRQLLITVCQNSRLQNPEIDRHRQVIWDTAVNVIAPVLLGFVQWCLIEAQQRRIERLYFVARDGQILCKIADVLCRNWGYPIDCRYLYASRQSLHFPAIQQIGETELDWIFSFMDFLSVEIVCERLNLQPEQIAEILIQNGFPGPTWNQNLTLEQQQSLKQVFRLPQVVDLILAQAAVYRSKAIGYLRQEGFADPVSFALVDTGWTGRSHRSMSRLLELGEIYPAQGLLGFYFGLKEIHRAFTTDQLIPYFISPDDVSERYLLANNDILELFLAADHGSTMRYELEGDRYIPVLRSEKNTAGLAWGLTVQQKAIIEFVEQLTQHLKPDGYEASDFYRVTDRLLKSFMFSPSREESEVFGSLVFSQQQSDSKFYTLAPRYQLTECLKIYLGLQKPHNFAWLPASIHRSSWLAKIPLYFWHRTKLGFVYAYLAFRNFEKKNTRGYILLLNAFLLSPAVILSRFLARSLPLMISNLFQPD